MTGAPGDGERLYVVEQRGTVQVVKDGVARPFLDLRDAVRGPDDVPAGTEEGLLSIAFAPDFQESRLLYAYFTDASGDANRVEELRAPTGDAADPSSRRLVISIPHAQSTHHNGGQIQFGPDGMLYVAPGDGGTGGAPARDLGSLLGKLLRIDPRGALPGRYTVPASNPFAGDKGRRGEIWAYGLRNPYRFSFDRLYGNLTIGDVGEKTIEEIDYLQFARGNGFAADLGWNACEGRYEKGTARPCELRYAVMPAVERTHADGYRAMVNGYVVRDPSLPSLFGRLVYGDFYVDSLRSTLIQPWGPVDRWATDDRDVGVDVHRLTSFGEDAGGCVYATSFEGAVYRLVEQDARVPCPATTPEAIDDTHPPGLRNQIRDRQRLLRTRGVVAYVRCFQGCTVGMVGHLIIGRAVYSLRPTYSSQAAMARERIVLRLGYRARRALQRGLAAGRKASVRMRWWASDASGNFSQKRQKTVRVRR